MGKVGSDRNRVNIKGDGLVHVISLPQGNEDVMNWVKDIDPTNARVYKVDATIDGETFSDAFAVGNMIVPKFPPWDSHGSFHPVLRLTLSAFYPKFIAYVIDYYVQTKKVKEYQVDLHDLTVLN
jgi:hypothetical protein